MTPRRALLGLLAAGALPAPRRAAAQPPAPRAAAADAPVRLVTGAAEGSTADTWLRTFAPFLERHLPRRAVEVANRPGGGGMSALRELARGGPGVALAHALTPDLLARAVEQGATDLLGRLRFLAAVSEEPLVLVAPPGTELAALRRPGPPGVLALPAQGSAAALAAPLPGLALNLSPLHFASAAAARQAALGGTVAAALVRVPDAVAALRDGRLAALGVATAGRSALLPETPTLSEQGIPLVAAARRGLLLVAGATGADDLADALRAVVADPEYAAQAEALGTLPRFLDGPAWTAEVRRDLAALERRWRAAPWPERAG